MQSLEKSTICRHDYQRLDLVYGKANMRAIKGNSIANIGYSGETSELIRGWRTIWSKTNGITDPLTPFGIVTLASSGSVGGPDTGAMRHAQTSNYRVVSILASPNTFLAQAYDLNDELGPDAGPLFTPGHVAMPRSRNTITKHAMRHLWRSARVRLPQLMVLLK